MQGLKAESPNPFGADILSPDSGLLSPDSSLLL
jgi:hypothetical protein